MDILIKNMEMPKSCIDPQTSHGCFCILHCNVGRKAVADGKSIDGRPKYCPLVEVKPHGRLIDADRLRQVMEKAMANDSDKPLYKMMYSYVIQVLAESPTVLEATNE